MSATLVDFRDTPFLKTSCTGFYPNRLNWRAEILLTRNREVIESKRVLDLASHDGRFSYACLKLGASRVVGIEGRSHLIQHAETNLRSLGYTAPEVEFLQGDIFDRLASFERGAFDTILCLGWIYHTVRQIELMREFKRLRSRYLIVDSGVVPDLFEDRVVQTVIKLRASVGRITSGAARGRRRRWSPDSYLGYLVLMREDHSLEGATLDSIDAIAFPTKSFLEFFLSEVCSGHRQLSWTNQGITDWSALSDYRQGLRVSYLGENTNAVPCEDAGRSV